jgi:hypothetical protein
MSDLEQAIKPAPYLCEVGVSGVKRYGGYIYEEFLSNLQGKAGQQVYREMMANEAVIAASLWVFRVLLQQTPWYLEAADDSPQATEVRDFCDEALHDFDGGMPALIARALTAFGYGFALCEKVYKIRRGPEYPMPYQSQYHDMRWGIRKLPLRKQTSIEEWIYDDVSGDNLRGVVQLAETDARRRIIPINKLLHFRFKSVSESPEGESALRPCYPSYYAVKHARFIEGVGIERYMAGIPVATVPPSVLDASAGSKEAATREAFEKLVSRVRRDEQSGIVMPAKLDADSRPTGYDFFLLSGGGDKPADVDPVIRRYESRMAMVLLTEVMLLGSDSMGSYALSKDKNEMLVTGLAAILDSIFEVVQSQLLTELVSINGWPTELTPQLKHGPIKAPNMADLGSFLSSMAGAGLVVPGEAAETWAREQLGMPAEERPTFAREAVAPVDASLGEPAAPTAAEDNVQQQVLNGAQVTALADVVQRVAAGVLPRDAAVGIVSVGFRMTEADAERLLGSAGRVVIPGAANAL